MTNNDYIDLVIEQDEAEQRRRDERRDQLYMWLATVIGIGVLVAIVLWVLIAI